MRPHVARLVACAALAALACKTGYNNAYDAEYKRLEQEQQAQQQADAVAHGQAERFVAVVYFQTGSSALDENAVRQLNWFVDKMAPYPLATFDVQGFADATGSESTNQMLSNQRSQVVSAYLQSQGIQASRIYAAAFSTSSPAASNATEKGRRDNRRVEVTVR